jgi:aspartyl protease family protein
MATGFMLRHFMALCLALTAASARAADVVLVGLIGDKAVVLSIDGGEPKTVRIGQKWSGISVISIEGEKATLEIEGKRRVLSRGQHAGAPNPNSRQSVTLSADTRGHFVTDAAINGGQVRVLVDTGASTIALPARDAQRLGIDYRKGQRLSVSTAAGATEAYRVMLDTVRVGGIELHNVEGVVIEKGLEIGLLGMTFLNRLEMRRDGPQMTLTRRF